MGMFRQLTSTASAAASLPSGAVSRRCRQSSIFPFPKALVGRTIRTTLVSLRGGRENRVPAYSTPADSTRWPLPFRVTDLALAAHATRLCVRGWKLLSTASTTAIQLLSDG